MTNMISSIAAALTIAVNYAGLSIEDIRLNKGYEDNGYIGLDFCTAFARYDIFVDCATGEVAGFNFEPIPVISSFSFTTNNDIMKEAV